MKGDASTCSKSGQWLVQSLLLGSSQQARHQSLAIFKKLINSSQRPEEVKQRISELLLEYLDSCLENSPLASEEYFNLLTQLLTGQETT